MQEKKKEIPKWAIILIIILVIAVIGGGLGNNGSNSSKFKEQEGKTEVQEDLELEDGYTGAPDEYGFAYYIEGYIKNNTDKEYSYVQVEFTTYDSEGNTLGTCIDNNSGLEAQGRWKFKAMCTEEVDKIASYKLKEITKW